MYDRMSLPRTCTACGGSFHMATGHVFTMTAVLCGRCAKDFWEWRKARERMLQAHMKDKITGQKQKISFAEAASCAIIGVSGGDKSGDN